MGHLRESGGLAGSVGGATGLGRFGRISGTRSMLELVRLKRFWWYLGVGQVESTGGLEEIGEVGRIREAP